MFSGMPSLLERAPSKEVGDRRLGDGAEDE